MAKKQTLHIGLDDTDSTKGGCTTYLAAVLVGKLQEFKVEYTDYPRLIRLNPNIPWKTRGNGALCLSFKFNTNQEKYIKKVALNLWKTQAAVDQNGTDPGIVFYRGSRIPRKVKQFSKKAETGVVSINEAISLAKEIGAEAHGFNSCRGIIGSLAAIGETLEDDYTYELIAYRTEENLGTKRQVNTESIIEMDKETCPFTYNNVDSETGRIIITPRGPDPILFGIRGETPLIVKKAFNVVKSVEPIERWIIFRSNQGTDAHLTRVNELSKLQPYSSVITKGVVSKNPRIVPLRHVIFSIEDNTAEIDCAAYEPTGNLRKIARELTVGDNIEVYGAVNKATKSKPLTINLEKIKILNLSEKVSTENPSCPTCGKHLKSLGKDQGYGCKKCGNKYPKSFKTRKNVSRSLKPGLYFTSERSQRHLTKPLRRYGQEKSHVIYYPLIADWHFP